MLPNIFSHNNINVLFYLSFLLMLLVFTSHVTSQVIPAQFKIETILNVSSPGLLAIDAEQTTNTPIYYANPNSLYKYSNFQHEIIVNESSSFFSDLANLQKMKFYQGELYYSTNTQIRKIDNNSNVKTVIGAFGEYGRKNAPAFESYLPNSVAISMDYNNDNIYVASSAFVKKFSQKDKSLNTTFGYDPEIGNFNVNILSVAFDNVNNEIIHFDTKNFVLQRMNSEGNLTTIAGIFGQKGSSVYNVSATQSKLSQWKD